MDNKITDNLDVLIHDIKECKYSLEMLLMNLGNDEQIIAENKVDWPFVLNNLRIASTNLISISKFLKDKREVLLKTSILMPKFFSEDVDPELKVTKSTTLHKSENFLSPSKLKGNDK